VRHPVDDVAPALLVIAVAEDLLIRVTPVAVHGEQLLFFTAAGQALQPFRSGQLGGNLGKRRAIAPISRA